jgi:hypothetical protein
MNARNAPGSPIGIHFAHLAKAEVPAAVGLGVMLVTVAIVSTPLTAGLIMLEPRVAAAMSALAALGWVLGYALGGHRPEVRLAFGTGFRNAALSLLVAASLGERAAMTGVVAAVLVALIIHLLFLLAVRRRRA